MINFHCLFFQLLSSPQIEMEHFKYTKATVALQDGLGCGGVDVGRQTLMDKIILVPKQIQGLVLGYCKFRSGTFKCYPLLKLSKGDGSISEISCESKGALVVPCCTKVCLPYWCRLGGF